MSTYVRILCVVISGACNALFRSLKTTLRMRSTSPLQQKTPRPCSLQLKCTHWLYRRCPCLDLLTSSCPGYQVKSLTPNCLSVKRTHFIKSVSSHLLEENKTCCLWKCMILCRNYDWRQENSVIHAYTEFYSASSFIGGDESVMRPSSWLGQYYTVLYVLHLIISITSVMQF